MLILILSSLFIDSRLFDSKEKSKNVARENFQIFPPFFILNKMQDFRFIKQESEEDDLRAEEENVLESHNWDWQKNQSLEECDSDIHLNI